jgi:hypothetical protein
MNNSLKCEQIYINYNLLHVVNDYFINNNNYYFLLPFIHKICFRKEEKISQTLR